MDKIIIIKNYIANHSEIFPDSYIREQLINLFNKVNQDCEKDGEEVYPLDDESYIDQIFCILEDFCPSNHNKLGELIHHTDKEGDAIQELSYILFNRMQKLI